MFVSELAHLEIISQLSDFQKDVEQGLDVFEEVPSFLLMSIKNGFDGQWHCEKTDLRLVLHKGCETTVTTVLSLEEQIIFATKENFIGIIVLPKRDYFCQLRINGDDFHKGRYDGRNCSL